MSALYNRLHRIINWRKYTTFSIPKDQMDQEVRSMIPLVSRGGCVDIKALRKAIMLSKQREKNYEICVNQYHKLIIYHYLKEIDKDGDEPMLKEDGKYSQ